MDSLLHYGCLIILIAVMFSLGLAIIEKIKLDGGKNDKTLKK